MKLAVVVSISFSFFGYTQTSNLTSSDVLPYTLNDTLKKVKIIEPVIIQSTVQGKTITIGKSDIKPIDLPQSIQVIDGKIIEQQQAIRLSDVIKNVNGAYVGSARGGAQESFWSRGYDMSANNMFKNGFRVSSGSMPEVASLDQVEFLKGSSALLYGNVAPGGILNLVTKSPSFAQGGAISFQAGSYDYYKPTIDFYGPLSKSVAYRFVSSYENSKSFRDVVARKRIYINPSVLFKLNEKTTIVLQADYLKDNWTPDFGTAAIGQDIVNLPRNTYLGVRWSNGLTKQATFTNQISHQINAKWKFNANTSYQYYSRFWEGTERIQPSANGTLTRPLGKNNTDETILAQQFNWQGKFQTGKIKHQLSTGVDLEYAKVNVDTYVFNPVTYDVVSIYNPTSYENDHGIPSSIQTKIVTTKTKRFGAYLQDLMSLTSKLKVLAGLRWSWQESQATTYNYLANVYTPGNDPNPIQDPKRLDKAFSPKIGFVFQPKENMSLFASIANSFTPNTGVDIYNNTLAPSIIDQYEIGIKKGFWNTKLTTNITYYYIVNNNLAQIAELKADGTINTNTNVKALSGQTVSKGIELDIVAKPIIGLQLLAGYSYNDMRYTKTSGATGSFIEGDRLVRTPQNTANFSVFYTIENGKWTGFSVGALASYTGSRLGGWNNTNGQTIPDRTIPVSDYTTIDASVGYTWNQFSILCKMSNIANTLNYTVHENYSINPIAPRQFLTTIKYKF